MFFSYVITSKKRMIIKTLLTLMLMMCARSEEHSQECKPGRLDSVSSRECGNKGYAMRCNNTGIVEIPRQYPRNDSFTPPFCLLDLSSNRLINVNNDSFRDAKNLVNSAVMLLYLFNCSLTSIASRAFDNFTSLVYLNLSENSLKKLGSLKPGVFSPLVSLKNINLRKNYFTTYQELNKELRSLANLQELFIELCANCTFGEEFQNLMNLTIFNLSGTRRNSCVVPLISNETFRYTVHAERISLSSCNIQDIEEGAFSNTRKLIFLDLSYNEQLNFTGMNKALYGLRNSSTLKKLNVNRIYSLWETGIEVKEADMENLKTLKALETLHMDLNKIEVFEENIAKYNLLPKSLRNLTLTGNRLTYGKYVKHLGNITNIKNLDISRQHLNDDPFFHNHFDNDFVQKKTENKWAGITDNSFLELDQICVERNDSVIYVPPDVSSLVWRKSFLDFQIESPIIVCSSDKLRHLDLSFNLITKLNSFVYGLNNLTHLNLAENYCSEMVPDFFNSFSSLIHLNISDNLLGMNLDPRYYPNASQMFNALTKLRNFDMSLNQIRVLPRDIFMQQTQLNHLNLANNLIEQWNSTLNTSECLQKLDLSGNKLATLPEFLTKYLDMVHDRYCKGNRNLTLDLSSNPLECTCKGLSFLKWTLETEVSVLVTDDDACRINGDRYSLTSPEDMKRIIDILETDVCVDKNKYRWYITSGSSGLTAVLSIALCMIVYRNRWKIRYVYYSRNRRYIHEGYDHLFESDAFVSYAKDNASFIKREMVPSLEGQHGLHLWVADRNSIAGNSIAENITHAIYNSKKAVLLIDNAYLKDKWCDYEMHMAVMESVETKRRMVIVVLYEAIPMDALPLCILKLLRCERTLEFPQNHQAVNTFWMNLASEIRSET